MSRWWNRFLPTAPLTMTLGSGRCTAEVPGGQIFEQPLARVFQPKDLHEALDALLTSAAAGTAAAATGAARAHRAEVWLGAGVCAQAVVPVDTVEMRRSQLQDLLNAQWAELLDAAPQDLQVSYNIQRGRRSVVTACCQRWVPQVMSEVAVTHQLGRLRIAPQAVRIWDDVQAQVTGPDGVLVIHSSAGDLELGAFSSGCWTHWESSAGEQDALSVQAAVSRFVRFNRLRDSAPVWLHTTGLAQTKEFPLHWTRVKGVDQELA